MNAVRTQGIHRILQTHSELFAGKDLLEIGSGTGAQLLVLREMCKSATGIEIAGGLYGRDALTEIGQYDGRRMPFPDASFDVIFSSNVLEHIAHEETIHAEMHRVLRPGGLGFHIVPSATWRIVASVAHYPWCMRAAFQKLIGRISGHAAGDNGAGVTKPVTHRGTVAFLKFALLPPRHGEFGNWFTEHLFLFRAGAWRKRFEAHDWQIESMGPVGLFHTGCCLMGPRLSWRMRTWLGKTIGSSELFFVLRPAASPVGLSRAGAQPR